MVADTGVERADVQTDASAGDLRDAGPGRPNEHQLAGLEGRWSEGHVHGRLVEAGWGADLGYPAPVLDPAAPEVPVHVFESPDLLDQWPRLGTVEGPGHERVRARVHMPSGNLAASIYVHRAAPENRCASPAPGRRRPVAPLILGRLRSRARESGHAS